MLKDKEEIKNWLDQYEVKNYTINDDFTVDVDGYVNISGNFLTHIPVQFGIIKNNFYCNANVLKSLQGGPKTVHGDFYCNNNQLTSLQGSPEYIGGDFNCKNNQLTSLEGSPKTVHGDFYCNNNQLTSLQGSSKTIGKDFDCRTNELTTLKGSPEYIGGNFNCSNNKLTILKEGPKAIGLHFYCNKNPINNIDLNIFDTNFNGIFYHYGSIIEEFSDFYINDKLVLINKDIHNIKLYTKLNDIIENKTESINKHKL